MYTQEDLENALEYGLDYGYNQGFANASEDVSVYRELNTKEVFNDYVKSSKEDGSLNPKEMFTKDQMFLFAGYCMGKRLVNPEKDATEIMEEFKVEFNINKDA